MRSPRRRVAVGVACAAGLLVVLRLLAGLASSQGTPAGLGERKGRLVAAELGPAVAVGASHVQPIVIRGSTGLTINGRLRLPDQSRPPLAGVVLVGGIKRGSRIVATSGLDAIARDAVLVSLDYPIRLKRASWRGLDVVSTIARLRPAAFDTVAEILLLLDYLESRPDVDPHRLFLVGGSLGAVAVSVAGGVDPRPAAVIALYGGGRLGSLIAHTLEQPAQDVAFPRWEAQLAGHALAWLISPLAPEPYVAAIAPRPFVMVNGVRDSLVPPDYARALYDAARYPKRLIWVDSDHVQPSETDLLDQLSGIVTSWLVAQRLLPAHVSAERSH